MPQPAKNAAKKRPIPIRRWPVVKGGKMPAPANAGAEDDVKITALKLPPGTLSPEMDAYFKKCDEKLGFVLAIHGPQEILRGSPEDVEGLCHCCLAAS